MKNRKTVKYLGHKKAVKMHKLYRKKHKRPGIMTNSGKKGDHWWKFTVKK